MGHRVGQALKVIAAAITPPAVLLILFSNELLGWWLGAAYAARSSTVFTLQTAAIFLNSLAFPFVALVEGAGRPDVVTKYHLVELPAYLAVMVLLVRRFGIEGAAAALCLRMLWTLPVVVIWTTRAAGITLHAIMREGVLLTISFGSLLVLLSLAARAFVAGHQLLLLGLAVALICAHTAFAWRVGVSKAEREYFMRRLLLRT
jgi:O-antigen/teichoic acid export membrane protein